MYFVYIRCALKPNMKNVYAIYVPSPLLSSDMSAGLLRILKVSRLAGTLIGWHPSEHFLAVGLANKIELLAVFEHAEASVIVLICSSFALAENVSPWHRLCTTLSTGSLARGTSLGM